MLISQSEGMPQGDRLARRVLSVCDAAGAFIEYWGFKAIHGRVWALLALSKTPMSQTEIVECLGVSKALVSSVMSELAAYGLVRPVAEKRNAPYVAVMDVWPVISEILRTREWMLIETARVALEATLEEAELRDEFGEPNPYDTARIRLLLSLTESAQGFLKLVVALRVPRTVDTLGRGLKSVAKLVQSLRG
jgi:DNA-binding transcriptional regulator GbsR (MarR family)